MLLELSCFKWTRWTHRHLSRWIRISRILTLHGINSRDLTEPSYALSDWIEWINCLLACLLGGIYSLISGDLSVPIRDTRKVLETWPEITSDTLKDTQDGHWQLRRLVGTGLMSQSLFTAGIMHAHAQIHRQPFTLHFSKKTSAYCSYNQ